MTVYCGSKPLPKNRVYGDEKQCAKQLRLYGHKVISQDKITKLKLDGKSPLYCGSKQSTRKHGTLQQCKKKGQLRRYGIFKIHDGKVTNIKKENNEKNAINKIDAFVKMKKQQKQYNLLKKKYKENQDHKLKVNKKNENNAMNKIEAFVKMKKEKQKFDKLMKNINSAQFRKRTILKKMLNVPKQFTGENILLPSKLAQYTTVLSRGETGSEASVALIGLVNGDSMICKFTETDKFWYDDPGRHEMLIYKLVNKLVSHNVTPFIIKNIKNKLSLIGASIHSRIRRRLGLSLDKYYHVILNESVPSNNVLTFGKCSGMKIISREIHEHLTFQVLWTLECFNRIGLRHNDLHTGNILVMKHKRPKKTYRIFKYTEQGKTRIMYVPTTEYEVRIFDFDRSGKALVNADSLKSVFEPEISLEYKYDNFMKSVTQPLRNPQYDTYKFMNDLKYTYKIDGFKHKTRLTLAEKNAIQFRYQKNKQPVDRRIFYDYHLLILENGNNIYVDGYPTTIKIMEHIATKLGYFNKPPSDWKLVEIYDMDNLYSGVITD